MSEIKKIDRVVLRETAYIAVWVLIFSTLLQSVFLMCGLWQPNVLFGNLYSAVIVILNFFLMGLSIQKAVAMSGENTENSEKNVKNYVKAIGTYRLLGLFVLVVLGALISQKGIFNIWAVIVPLFFPRVAIVFRPYFKMLDVEEHSAPVTDTDGANINNENIENIEKTEEINGEGGKLDE